MNSVAMLVNAARIKGMRSAQSGSLFMGALSPKLGLRFWSTNGVPTLNTIRPSLGLLKYLVSSPRFSRSWMRALGILTGIVRQSAGIHSGSLRLGASRRRSVVVADPEFHLPSELAEWGFENVRNPPQPAHGRIEYPSFQTADVGAVEAAIGAEAFLRMARLFAEFAHDDSDGFRLQIGRLDLPLSPLHGQIRWW